METIGFPSPEIPSKKEIDEIIRHSVRQLEPHGLFGITDYKKDPDRPFWEDQKIFFTKQLRAKFLVFNFILSILLGFMLKFL